MNRRAILAALTAWVLPELFPQRANAEREPFPLMPRPNPGASCAEPFLYQRETETEDEFLMSLLLWAHKNPHVSSAYVALAPEMGHLRPASWEMTLLRTTFRFGVIELPPLPPNVPWAILADCGQLL